MTKPGARRLGRPPAANSADTRRRILEVARQTFAEHGYGVTTNKFLATKVGITTGALYHYFDSKLDIYLAVHKQVEDVVYERLDSAVAAHDTFATQLAAVFDESYRINLEDPSIAQFLGSARVDMSRHPELGRAFRSRRNPARTMVALMVERGLATGELRAQDREKALAMLRTMFVGLVDAVARYPDEQRQAMDGFIALVRGELVQPRARRAKRSAG